jgi:integrase
MLSYFCQDRRRFKLSTRIYISKKYWSELGQRVIPSAPSATEINISLEKFVTTITEIISALKSDGVNTTPEAIQERFKELTQERISERKDRLFLPFLNEALGTTQNPGRIRRKLMPNSLKIYFVLRSHLVEAEKRNITPLTFESFTPKFFINFVEQLSKTMGANATRKLCGLLKTLLRLAVVEERTEFRGFENARVDLKTTEPVTVYLSEVEINAIYDLKNNPEILAREDSEMVLREADRIVLGCWLGLRWSDLSRIEKKHIYKQGDSWFLTIGTQKTEETVILPLHPTALEILQKYNFCIPKASQQKVNVNIKKVCELAKINEPVSTPSGIRPKYAEVTTHTMRRSFATNLIRLGVSHYHVMKLGGWKSFASFERYIRLGKQEAADKVAEVFAGNLSPLRKVG